MFVLGMVAGPRRELNIAQLLQLAPHSGLVERHRKFLMEPLDQVDQPPANDAMDRRDRAALNRFNERPALVVIEPRPGAGSFAVKQPIRAAIIEANHPVAHDLQAPIADPRRRRPASTPATPAQGQAPPALVPATPSTRHPPQCNPA